MSDDDPNDAEEPIDPDEVIDEPPEIPLFVQELMKRGLVSDDLILAEVSATGGPTYDLDEMDIAMVENLVGHLDGNGLQWAIDRAGRLVVHRNDERRADAVFEELFGPDDEGGAASDMGAVRSEVESLAAKVTDPISSSGGPRALYALGAVIVVLVLALVLL